MQYILSLLWLGFVALLGRADGMYHREFVFGKEERRATWRYAILVMAPLILQAAFRSNYFGDTYVYLLDYRSIPFDLDGKLTYIQAHSKDRGFYALGALVSIFAGQHFRYFFLFLAAIQGYCLMKTYRRYSEDYWLAIFVFVASTDIYSWMYNGLRQFLAVAVVFASSGWIFKRKYVKAILAILIASLFHQSALMMIPVIFIVLGKPWNWKTVLVILSTVLIMTFSGVFIDTLDTVLADTQYRNVVSDWRMGGDDGTNPLRVLVYSVPTILSLFCRRKIQQTGDRVVQVACNMGIISTALYLVSMVTSGVYIGRLPIYCSLFANGILLPWELKHVFGRQMKAVAMVFYVLFYFLQLRLVWGVI